MPPGLSRQRYEFEFSFVGAKAGREDANSVADDLERIDSVATRAKRSVDALAASVANLKAGEALRAQDTLAAANEKVARSAERVTQASATRLRQMQAERDALRESIRLNETLAQSQSRVRIARAGVIDPTQGVLQSEIEARAAIRTPASTALFGGTVGSLAGFAGRALVASTAFGAVYGGYRAIRRGFGGLIAGSEDYAQAELGAGGAILTAGRYYDQRGQQLPISQQFAIARRQGSRVLDRALRDSSDIGLNYDSLRQGYSSSAGFLNAATQDPEKQVKVLEGLVTLSDRLGVSQGQVRRTIDNIIKGVRVQNTELGSTLGLTSKQVQEWRASGTLIENLLDHLAGFSESAKENLDTVTGVKNAIKATAELVAKESGGGFYREIVGAQADFLNKLHEIERSPERMKELEQTFTDIGKAIRFAANMGVGLLDVLAQMGTGFFSANRPQPTGTPGVIQYYDADGDLQVIDTRGRTPGNAGVPLLPGDVRDLKREAIEADGVASNFKANPEAKDDKAAARAARKAAAERRRREHSYIAQVKLQRKLADERSRRSLLAYDAEEADARYRGDLLDVELSDAEFRGYSIATRRDILLERQASGVYEYQAGIRGAEASLSTAQAAKSRATADYREAKQRFGRARTPEERDLIQREKNEARLEYERSISEIAQAELTLADRHRALELATRRYASELERLDNVFLNSERTIRSIGQTLIDSFFGGGDFKGALRNWATGQLRNQAGELFNQGVDRAFSGGGGGFLDRVVSGVRGLFGDTGAADAARSQRATPTPAIESGRGRIGGGGAPAGAGAGAGAGLGAGGWAAIAIMAAQALEGGIKGAHRLRQQGGYSQQEIMKKASGDAAENAGLPRFVGELGYLIGGSDPGNPDSARSIISGIASGGVSYGLGAIFGAGSQPKTEGAFTRKNLSKLLDAMGIPRVGQSIGAAKSPTRILPGLGRVNLDAYTKTSGFGGLFRDIVNPANSITGGVYSVTGVGGELSGLQRGQSSDTRYRLDFNRGLSFRDFGAYGNSLDELASLAGVYLNINPKTGKPVDLGKGGPPPAEDIGRAILTNAALLGLSAEDARAMARKVNQGAAGSFDEGVNKLLAIRSRGLQQLASGRKLTQRSRPAAGLMGADSPTYDTDLRRSDLDRQLSASTVALLDSYENLSEGIDKARLATELLDKDGVAHIERLKRAAEDTEKVFREGIPNAIDAGISGEDYFAPGRAIADAVYKGFEERLKERMLQEGAVGKYITAASVEASAAAEALAKGDYTGFDVHARAAAEQNARGESLANETFARIGAYSRQFQGQLGIPSSTGVVVGATAPAMPRMPRRAAATTSVAGMPGAPGSTIVASDPYVQQLMARQNEILSLIAHNTGKPIVAKLVDGQLQIAVLQAIDSANATQSTGSYIPTNTAGVSP